MTSQKTSMRYIVFIIVFLGCSISSSSWAQVSPTVGQAPDEGKILQVHPSFSVSERYQDNVRQGAFDGREEDFSVMWRPGLDIKYKGDRHEHELSYDSTFTRYHHLHDEDMNTHNVSLENHLELGRIVEFDLATNESFRSERQDPRQSERRNNFLETNVFTVAPTLRFNVLENTSLVGFYTFSRTSILEKDKEDYLSNTLGGSLNQHLFDELELIGGYRNKRQEFLGDSPGFVDNVFFGGLNLDITPTLRLEGEYGRTIRKYDKETDLVTESKTTNDVWSVALRNDITDTTHVDISYSQSQQVREISNTQQVITETVTARINQIFEGLFSVGLTGSYSEDDFEFEDRRDITSRVDLGLSTEFSEIICFRAGGGYGNNYFWPDAVRENVYDYRAGIDYYPLEWLSGSVDYQHRETDSDASEDILEGKTFRSEYVQNSITFTIAARF